MTSEWSRSLSSSGRIESIGPNKIVGWLTCEINQDKAELVISTNFGTFPVIANLRGRPDLGKAVEGKFAKAFEADIPLELPAHSFSTIEIFYGETKIPKSKGFVARSPFRFEILKSLGRYFNGYVCDERNIESSLELFARVSDQNDYVLQTIVSESLDHIEGLRGKPAFFEFIVPADLNQSRGSVTFYDKSLTLVLGEATWTNRRHETSSPIAIPIGKVDQIGPHWISGWACPDTSGEAAKVKVIINGETVETSIANRPREDVSEKFGLGDCGFLIPFTRRGMNFGKNVIEIFHSSLNRVIPTAQNNIFNHIDVGDFQIKNNTAHGKIEVSLFKQNKSIEILEDGQPIGQVKLSACVTELSKQYCNIQVELPFIDGQVTLRLLPSGIPLQRRTSEQSIETDLRSNFDGVNEDYLTGWIFDEKDHGKKLDVLAFIDGNFIGKHKAGDLRRDLKALNLSNLAHGFRIPIPSFILDGLTHSVDVREANTLRSINGSPKSLTLPKRLSDLPSFSNPHLRLFTVPRERIEALDTSKIQEPKWTFIILNKDAASVLDRALHSIFERLSQTSFEIILVDHASQDRSIEVCEKWQTKLPLTIVCQPGNNSFSFSNNFASLTARGEYLAFINNDIVFISNPFPAIERVLNEEEDVGLVGIKLLEVGRDRTSEDMGDFRVHHLGISFMEDSRTGTVRPMEIIADKDNLWRSFERVDVASVTGAFACMRASDFVNCGRFDEDFFYGYEDVALGLQVRQRLNKKVISLNDQTAFHHRGYVRLSGKVSDSFMARVIHNERILEDKFSRYITESYNASLFGRDWIFSAEKLRLAFIVFQAGLGARAGDYFTALELGKELEALLGCEVSFITPDDGWDDFSQFHIVINMRNEFDIKNVKKRRRHCLFVAWLRNNYEDWRQSSRLELYDIVLSSSDRFRAELIKEVGISAERFEIASTPNWAGSGVRRDDLETDVVFNGSFAGAQRSLATLLDGRELSFKFSVVGDGWAGTALEKYWLGFLPYDRMPDVYASTKIVIDDANSSARLWGGTNSRVFDASAAGRVVISNSIVTSDDTFDGNLPVWQTEEDLISQIQDLLRNPEEIDRIGNNLKSIVKSKHTYSKRADQFHHILQHRMTKARIAIKIATPNPRNQHVWGDYHFAMSLAKELRRLGYTVRVDTKDSWQNEWSRSAINIVLRGLERFEVERSSINLMWIISHPEQISQEELASYDHVYTCGERLTQYVKAMGIKSASTMLQCADGDRMSASSDVLLSLPAPFLFVGNTRGVFREGVKYLSQSGLPFCVAGEGWDSYLSASNIFAENISNEKLGSYYRAADLVINDHWPAMRAWGMVSNRVFDVAAAGGSVLSDQIDGQEAIFGDLLLTYHNQDEFVSILEATQSDRTWLEEKRLKLQELVLAKHTFRNRALQIASMIGGA